jgi:hypothetical protein
MADSRGRQRLHLQAPDHRRIRLSKNLIHLLPYLCTPRRLRIPHGFHVGVSEPLLHRPQIDEQNIGQLGLLWDPRARHDARLGSNTTSIEWRDFYDRRVAMFYPEST